VIQGVVIVVALATSFLLWARTVTPRPRVLPAASTCRKCAYSLVGLDKSAVCPECGTDEPWYREHRRSRDQVRFDQWGVSAMVLGLCLLATLWPIVLHEVLHPMAGWLNRRGVGPIFSPGRMPSVIDWAGLPLAGLMLVGYAVAEQSRRTRLRVGVMIAGAVWLILSVMTLLTWIDARAMPNYEGIETAGELGVILCGAACLVFTPIVLIDFAGWLLVNPRKAGEPAADRAEWLERSREDAE
jgi:hypothetical protein